MRTLPLLTGHSPETHLTRLVLPLALGRDQQALAQRDLKGILGEGASGWGIHVGKVKLDAVWPLACTRPDLEDFRSSSL